MQTIEQYCRSFELAHAEWPSLPLPATAQELWWRNWLEQHEQQRVWDSLRLELPQLCDEFNCSSGCGLFHLRAVEILKNR